MAILGVMLMIAVCLASLAWLRFSFGVPDPEFLQGPAGLVPGKEVVWQPERGSCLGESGYVELEAVASFRNSSELQVIAEKHKEAFAGADFFPHILITGFAPRGMAIQSAAEIKALPRSAFTKRFSEPLQKKLALEDPATAGPATAAISQFFNSDEMISFLRTLTGIPDLVPDPALKGGGVHCIEPGGRLGVHADFNHGKGDLGTLYRRLNAILYLNEFGAEWVPETRGELQLWSHDLDAAVGVAPMLNHMVIFETRQDSWHGHPVPLAGNERRKSIAAYYYSKEQGHQLDEPLTTQFQTVPKAPPLCRREMEARWQRMQGENERL